MSVGASDFFIAMMFAVPFFSNIIQLFSPVFFERHICRKKFIFIFMGIYRYLKCTVIFIPLLFPRQLWMPLIFSVYLAANLAACFSMPAYNNLCISMAQGRIQYWFMPLKQALGMVVIVSSYLIFGKIIDLLADKYRIYILMYVMAIFTSTLAMFFLYRQ